MEKNIKHLCTSAQLILIGRFNFANVVKTLTFGFTQAYHFKNITPKF